MAYYLVTAMPKSGKISELKEKLMANEFRNLQPFGRALSYSLENARQRKDGTAVWEEEDYCSPPLKEEKEAVLNDFFKDIEVEQVNKGEGWAQIKNLPSLYGYNKHLRDDL